MASMLMIQLQAAVYPGTAYLNGAAVSASHRFGLHLGTALPPILKRIERDRPDLIGFSCMTGIHTEVLAMARALKARFQIPIILGGPHPTLFPEIIEEDCIDLICRGEGEFALIDLLNAISNKTSYQGIANLWVKTNGRVYKNDLRPLADPLDSLPMVDWSCYQGTVVQMSGPVVIPVRGCPYSCSYCFNAQTRQIYGESAKRYVRYLSPERAIQEVDAAIKVFAHSPVIFTSDTMGMDLNWMDEMLSRYAQLTDLPFIVLLRPELANQRVITLLAKYRCCCVALGVESGSERVRREVLNRNYSNALLLEVAENLHRAGIKFRTYNMLGIPTETEDEMWETINLNVAMRTDYPRGAVFMPFPGTKIVALATRLGYLSENFSYSEVPATILTKSVLKNADVKLIENTLYFFQTAVLFPRLRRIIRALTHWAPNPLFKLWFYLLYLHLHRRLEGHGFWSYARYVFANRHFR